MNGFWAVAVGATAAPEAELHVLILESAAVTLWRTILPAAADPRILSGWGKVLQIPIFQNPIGSQLA
jgi:hypothetical protein